jgi:LPXTG-motif cell wall-anchored protein
MAVSATQVTQEALSYAVITDKNGLVKLLKRNGIQLGNNPSDKEVTVAVLMACSRSENFKNELAYLLTKKVKEAGETLSFVGTQLDFGFTGIDDFSFTGAEDFYKFTGADDFFKFTGEEDFFNMTAAERAAKKKADADAAAAKKKGRVTAENPKGKTGAGLLLANIGRALTSQDTINAGIQIGLNKINNKTQADANQIASQADLLQAQQDEMKKNLPDAKTGISNTAKFVLIGAGVLAVIGVVYLVIKNKKA